MALPELKLDSLFKDDFFKMAEEPKEDEVILSFPLPDRKHPHQLPNFLKENGDDYRKGIKNLIDQLKTWMEKYELLDEKAINNLHKFLKNFNQTGKEEQSGYYKTVLPLFTDGVSGLAKIINMIYQEKQPIEFLKDVIKNLVDGMIVCPPGIYINISTAYLKLVTDLPSKLMGYRRLLAAQLAQEIINQYRKEWDIYEGNDIHYVNIVLNLHHRLLGIPIWEDNLAPVSLPAEFEDLFRKRLVNQFTTTRLIETMIADSYCWENVRAKEPEKIKGSEVDAVNDWLALFGKDNGFNFRDSLFVYDDDKDQFLWGNGVLFYLYKTLFKRLIQSGYIDLEQMQLIKKNSVASHHQELKETSQTELEFYIPKSGNVALAYVKNGVEEKPCVVYYAEQFGRSNEETIFSKEQLDALQQLAEPLLKEIGINMMSNVTIDIEIKEKWLNRYREVFPNHTLTLLEYLSGLDEKNRLRLAEQYKLHECIKNAKSPDQMIAYITLFPKEKWFELLDSELTKNLYEGHQLTLIDAATLLFKNNRLDNKNLRQLLNCHDYDFHFLADCLSLLEKIDKTLISDVNFTLLVSLVKNPNIPRRGRNGLFNFKSKLIKIFSNYPALATNDNLILLVNNVKFIKWITKVLNILHQADPALLNGDNFKLLVSHSQKLLCEGNSKDCFFYQVLGRLYDYEGLTDANFKLIANAGIQFDYVYQISTIVDIISLLKINNLLNEDNHKQLAKHCQKASYISEGLEILSCVSHSLITQDNLNILFDHAEHATTLAYIIKNLYEKKPELATTENVRWLATVLGSVYNKMMRDTIIDTLGILSTVDPKLINDENRGRLAEVISTNYIIDLNHALKVLVRRKHRLINQDILRLLFSNPFKAVEISLEIDRLYKISSFSLKTIAVDKTIESYISALEILSSAHPKLMNEDNRMFLRKNVSKAVQIANEMKKLYEENPVLATVDNAILLAEIVLYDADPALMNVSNHQSLMSCIKHAPIITNTLFELLKIDEKFINQHSFNALVSLIKANDMLDYNEVNARASLFHDLYVFINQSSIPASSAGNFGLFGRSIDVTSIEAAENMIKFISNENVIFESDQLDALRSGELNKITNKYNEILDINLLPCRTRQILAASGKND